MNATISCVLCSVDDSVDNLKRLGLKGALTARVAADSRGEYEKSLLIVTGAHVHEKCRQKFTNKKDIAASCKRKKSESIDSHKKAKTRSSVGGFKSQTDCFFCSHNVDVLDLGKAASCVKTDVYVQSIIKACDMRQDDWAHQVRGRLNYLASDLHAADCVYHHVCDSNFRTGRSIPSMHNDDNSTGCGFSPPSSGRPVRREQEEAFMKLCSCLEKDDDEIHTLRSLRDKMGQFLNDVNSKQEPYSSRHIRRLLTERYGSKIVFSAKEGHETLVIYTDCVDSIIRSFDTNEADDDESKKKLIIKTAALLIKSDIKKIESDMVTYPSLNELRIESCLDFLPDSLRELLHQLCSGSGADKKVAMIGHAIIQNCRPRSVIAPLAISLAVQMHHMFRSRFLIDQMNALGLSSSYDEVTRFEQNAAKIGLENPIGHISDANTVLFAADNVDWNTETLDGKGTFHGLGILASVTPKNEHDRLVPRKKIKDLAVVSDARIPIREFRTAKRMLSAQKREFIELIIPLSPAKNFDLMWELSCKFHSPVPGWSGMMCEIHKSGHSGKSSFYFLPMIDLHSTDETCLYSGLRFICDIAYRNKVKPIVTFDQPLFWKASEILQYVDDSDSVKSVILMIGGFHLFMNLLGAIGDIMSGLGIRQMMEVIYAENSVNHILSGKAVQRAFRGHNLLHKVLFDQLIEPLMESDPVIVESIERLEGCYAMVKSGEMLVDDDDAISQIILNVGRIIDDHKKQVSSQTRTSKMWIEYMDLVQTARDFIRAERTGNWNLHLKTIEKCLPVFAAAGHYNYLKSAYLYLMGMCELAESNPDVYQAFQSGGFVCRRSEKFWSGLSSDLSIEQVYMRSIKARGGLTRGSGLSERQRAVWTLSMPICSEVNFSMQEFAGTTFTTSDQHRECSTSRIARDLKDYEKLKTFVSQFKPFSTDDSCLRNIVTGVHANETVNVDEFRKIGLEVIEKMKGQAVYQFGFLRKYKAKTMASLSSVKIDEDRMIDPAVLFQRMLIIVNTGDLSLEDVMRYELCPFPPALFTDRTMPLKADKPPLAHALKEYSDSLHEDSPAGSPETDHYVLDGGSLLHRLKWRQDSTYGEIGNSYCNLVGVHFRPTVIFDGYDEPGTKDYTHSRRNPRVNPEVEITDHTKFLNTRKENVLSNTKNKDKFIKLLVEKLKSRHCSVSQCHGDADVELAKAAVKSAKTKSTTLIGEDTDLLVLLIHYCQYDVSETLYLRSDKQYKKENNPLYDIRRIKSDIQSVGNSLLFLHAFTGCDTTSRIAGIGKKGALQKYLVNKKFRTIGERFCLEGLHQREVESLGVSAMQILFGKPDTKLNTIRFQKISSKIAKSSSFVKPDTLPPTEAATKFHALRVYLQIMSWMGVELDPRQWGWTMERNRLIPITTDLPAAPDDLLKVINCKCKGGCADNRCGCRKYGLPCTAACGPCQISHCANVQVIEAPPDEEDDFV